MPYADVRLGATWKSDPNCPKGPIFRSVFTVLAKSTPFLEVWFARAGRTHPHQRWWGVSLFSVLRTSPPIGGSSLHVKAPGHRKAIPCVLRVPEATLCCAIHVPRSHRSLKRNLVRNCPIETTALDQMILGQDFENFLPELFCAFFGRLRVLWIYGFEISATFFISGWKNGVTKFFLRILLELKTQSPPLPSIFAEGRFTRPL